ncbi:MAG: YdcF family protein [Myxococcales bacterium]|nr:YdcF family protein [Myxococcales bacterium]
MWRLRLRALATVFFAGGARSDRQKRGELLAAAACLALAFLLAVDAFRGARGLAADHWLALRPLHPGAAALLRLAGAAVCLSQVLRPTRSGPRHAALVLTLGVVALVAARDSLAYLGLLASGALVSRIPVPISLLVMAAALWPLTQRRRLPLRPQPGRRPPLLVVALGAGSLVAALTVAQMVGFGGTDYRRPADAVVVLGARVYRDGSPSLALADRLRTGCALVLEGQAPLLVLSGGPGDGPVHEVEAMRDMALACGLRPDQLRLDFEGHNTRRTAENLAAEAPELRRVLAVSHDYHLPRVRMAFDRAGVTAYTVPADETRTLVRLPYYMAREILAFWVYALAPGLARG